MQSPFGRLGTGLGEIDTFYEELKRNIKFICLEKQVHLIIKILEK